jgi:virginiamycin B lyase
LHALRTILVATGLSLLLASSAAAAPIGTLKQYKTPSARSAPRAIDNGSDGNLWFTEGTETGVPQVARITPSGAVTEFGAACSFCSLADIVQGPGGVLYFTSNDPQLLRITTAGQYLPPVPMPSSLANSGALAVHGGDVWIATFNDDSLYRYDTASGQFTQFHVPEPGGVAVDGAGRVWFSGNNDNAIHELDPATGGVSTIPVPSGSTPRAMAISTDGGIWFTEPFSGDVGRLDPATGTIAEFPDPGSGPVDIAPAAAGAMWFSENTFGSVARVTPDGTIVHSKAVKGSQPFGIVVAPGGDPWFAEFGAARIGDLQLR